MGLAHRALAIGAVVGMLASIANGEPPEKSIGSMVAGAVVGWIIGRYLQSRKAQR
ncbi:hypothetical protein GTZ99_08675 [Novosphingobium sp. FSY-8]|uniref:XapX domain-containing protein n=1 Tax=Novosphingobium ovatum TaxID=1908523 RepID=A0ABW9XDP9_9SPHN|nr:hypothetical protein [Novosphingobium ovatum]NBC36630.1 hypothetical protein [Novosphingobium ovatum]